MKFYLAILLIASASCSAIANITGDGLIETQDISTIKLYRACGRNLFFTPPLSYPKARSFCRSVFFTGRLVDIFGNEEFICFTKFLFDLSIFDYIYIGSWNGDVYLDQGIAIKSSGPGFGTISLPPGAPFAIYVGLCQL